MTSVLFFKWLKRFDVYAGSTAGRRAAVVLGNLSVRTKMKTASELENTEVIILPLKRLLRFSYVMQEAFHQSRHAMGGGTSSTRWHLLMK